MKLRTRKNKLIITLLAAGLLEAVTLSAHADMTETTKKLNAKNTNKSAVSVGEVSKVDNTLGTNEIILKNMSAIPKENITNSTQSQLQVGKEQLSFLSPAAGGIQLAVKLPGVYVSGSNPTGSVGDNALLINGFSVGSYSNSSATPNFNSIAVTLDGIPMNNPLSGDGGWYSTEIPIANLLSSTNIIYGPGNPDGRWQASIGGTLNFIPVQPSLKPKVKITGSYGSFDTQTESFNASTGLINGWTGIIAGGYTSGNVPGLEYSYPYRAYAFFAKALKFFNGGDRVSFGAYGVNSYYLDPATTPLTPIAGYTTNGYGVPGPLLSEATSGFYSTETPQQSYFYYRDNSAIFYSKQHIEISKLSSIDNKIWFRDSWREHYGSGNYNGTSSPTMNEYYTPNNKTYGDRVKLAFNLPHNELTFGGYIIQHNYHSKWDLFNPIYGTSINNPNTKNDVDMTQTNENIYLQDKLHYLHDTISITPGIAYAAYQTTLKNLYPATDSLNANGVINETLARRIHTNFSGIEPSIGFNWCAYNGISFYGNIAYTNENPNGESYGDYYEIYLNPNLIKLTKNLDFEGGIRFHDKGLFLNLNYYHDQVKNQIYGLYAQGTNFAPTGYELANSLYQGLNLQIHWKPIYDLMIYATANIQHSYYTSLNTSNNKSFSGNLIASIPLHLFSIGVSYEHMEYGGLAKINLDDKYVGSAGMANPITGDVTLRTNPYNLVNLNLSYKTTLIKRVLFFAQYADLRLGLYNLLNRHYNVDESVGSGEIEPGLPNNAIFGYQGAPRTIFGSLSLQF
ncbi:TonB-dependent receptor [Acidithiobacillus concretivorus]|uniref:TonB-dependent receptor n=1 Tax=Acidithiobacillus concretivorus TaxID=3063952 RepID=A0ABS5ZQE6_9PROT|nr:TonB-dependent receptor [Acidithiobacillus concretivorus]MBU2738892.1 TonB-dependent receptor [Acidithiobacillus concretivorus]